MSYTAKNLEEIAALFESRAKEATAEVDAYATTQEEQAAMHMAAVTWHRAADILRHTTLTEPCHMEKS